MTARFESDGSNGGPPPRYPDRSIRVLDERFADVPIFNAAVERLFTGCRWAEGPVWFGDHRCLVWSDIPNDRMLRYDAVTGAVSTFREPSEFSNGNTRDQLGRLVTCEHRTRRVTRTEHDGQRTVLCDGFDGKRLNAPNDVVVAADGTVWFTDPGYGSLSDYEGDRGPLELPTAVYRIDPDGTVDVVLDELARPNGLCFTPDGAHLYVVDSGVRPGTVTRYEVGGEGATLGAGEAFCDLAPGTADGVRCDPAGNLWAAAFGGGEGFDGVHVFAPDGARIGHIALPESPANLCFGGRRGNRLFVTASRSLYSVYLNVPAGPAEADG